MKILISNDDGIHSAGLKFLAAKLCENHEVYVIAPDRERSAAGHSLTLHRPLRVDKVDMGVSVAQAWETTGTPGDCVKIGINSILEEYQKLEEGQKGKVVVMMLTTSVNPADKAKTEKTLGSDCFKFKPLTLDMVNEIMKRHFPDYL